MAASLNRSGAGRVGSEAVEVLASLLFSVCLLLFRSSPAEVVLGVCEAIAGCSTSLSFWELDLLGSRLGESSSQLRILADID